ncbi:MAG: SGNH/GDSL hydrolase family protein [Myxococcota bacterium]
MRALAGLASAVVLGLAACGVVEDPAPLPSGPLASFPDAGPPATEPQDAGVVDAGVLVYPSGVTHSPLPPDVVRHLRAIAARAPARRDDLFAKVGDSNTVHAHHLTCFAGAQVELAGHAALEPTLAWFRAGRVDGGTPFERLSLAATVGWSAGAALAGAPSPLQQELDATQARFASVMFGTNDVGAQDPFTFGRHLFALVDALTAQGVVPLVSSVPPRDDSPAADAWVARYNLVARGVAQARRVPFVDLHRELRAAPTHGLGPDGIHLSVFGAGGARACVFTPAGLGAGHNVRNLVVLEALARARAAVVEGVASDDLAPRREGSGLPGDELVIDALPFVDPRDTRTAGTARMGSYPGCGALAEGGREVLYRLELRQPTAVRAFVVSPGGADVDLHLLSALTGEACLARGDRLLTRQLAAGRYWLSVDSTAAQAGEYLLVVMAD